MSTSRSDPRALSRLVTVAYLVAVIGWTVCVGVAWVSAARDTNAATEAVRRVDAMEAEVAGQARRIDDLHKALRLVQVYAEGTRSVVESKVMGGKGK